MNNQNAHQNKMKTSESLQASNAMQSYTVKRPVRVSTPLTLKDLFEGLAQLATSGVIETTEIIESIHREILLRPLGRFNDANQKKWSKGFTAKAYRAIRGITKKVGYRMAVPIVSHYPSSENATPLSPTLKQLVNIINGVIGDYLVEHDNAMAVGMRLYDRYGQPLTLSTSVTLAAPHVVSSTYGVSDRVVILVHGLCMSYLSWRLCEPDGLGERIAYAQPQTTVLYLDYNSGQPISNNGRDLSMLIQNLVDTYPNISQIDLVGHSMGGLVIRSAMFYASSSPFWASETGTDEQNKDNQSTVNQNIDNRLNNNHIINNHSDDKNSDNLHQAGNWTDKVGKIITLGTPHNGAILERIGYLIQDILTKIPFSSAVSSLVNIRSKGINDLRYGSICDDVPIGGFEKPPSLPHTSIALPSHITLYCIAGTLVEGIHDSTASQLLGDGLVVIDSAFGEYVAGQALKVAENHKAVFYGISHYNLMYHASIHQQVIAWLNEDDAHPIKDNKQPAKRLHIYQNNLKVDM